MSTAHKIDFSEIKTELVAPEKNFILKVEPAHPGLIISEWAALNREWIQSQLLSHGAILLRGFSSGLEEFKKAVLSISPKDSALKYEGGTTPRERVAETVYTSTSAPPQAVINQHHEMSYFGAWPMKVFFFCQVAAEQKGETPLTCSRRYMKMIDPAIIKRFREKGVRYIRNYSMQPTWRESFETDNKLQVEKFCKENNMAFEWRPNDCLRTVLQAHGTAFHPVTNEEIFFNQALNLGWNSGRPGVASPTLRLILPAVPPPVAKVLLNTPPEELPYATYYGDGSPIELSVQEEMQKVYDSEMVLFPWKEGDILIVENMLATHGRNTFSGPRKILASLTEKFSPQK